MTKDTKMISMREKTGGKSKATGKSNKVGNSTQVRNNRAVGNSRPAARRPGNLTLYEVVFAGLAILLAYPPYFRGLFFPREQEWTIIFAAVLFFGAWLWKLSRREVSFLNRPVDWLALALAVLYWLAVFWAANQRLAVDGAIKASIYFLVFWLVSRLAKDSLRMDILINALYLSAVGVAAAGFLTAVDMVHIKDGFLNGRIYSTMQYPNTLASYLGAISLLGFYLWGKATDRWRFFYAAGNYILLLIFIATGSRGGYLVYPVALLLAFVVTPRSYRVKLTLHVALTILAALVANYRMLPEIMAKNLTGAWTWVGLGLAVALAGQAVLLLARLLVERVKQGKIIVAVVLTAVVLAGGAMAVPRMDFQSKGGLAQKILPEQVFQRVRDISLVTTSSQDRIYWTKDALKILKSSPVTGLGGGAWEAAYRGFQGYQYDSTQVHNDWVQLWIEVGTLGLLLFVSIWFLTLLAGWRNYRRGSPVEKLRQGAVVAAMVNVGAHAIIDFDLALSAVAILLWALFGLTSAQRRVFEPAEKAMPAREFADSRWGYLGGAAMAAALLVTVASMLLAGAAYAKKGVDAAGKANNASAIAMFQRASDYDRFSANYLADLAKFYVAQGERDKAMQLIDAAIRRDQWNWKLYGVKAEMTINDNDKEQGIALLQQAREKAPWLKDPWENVSWAYAILGVNSLVAEDTQTAQEYLRKAIAVPEEMAARAAALGDTEKRLWPGWKGFQSAPRVQLAAGIGNYFLGRWKEAEPQLNVASKNAKTKGDGLMWLSLLRDKQGKNEEAKKLLQQAQEAGAAMAQNYERLQELPLVP